MLVPPWGLPQEEVFCFSFSHTDFPHKEERAGLAQNATYPRKQGQGIPEHSALQFSPRGKSLPWTGELSA